MPSLREINPYIRNAKDRKAILLRNAIESSMFEGARGLKKRLKFKAASKKTKKANLKAKKSTK